MPASLTIKAEMKGPLTFADFDKRVLKKEMRALAKPLVKASKKLVSGRGPSAPGMPPARISGALRGSITSRVSRSGFSLAVNSYRWKKGGEFYPAFVFYGHVGPSQTTATEKKRHSKRSGKKVAAPRENWITAVVEPYAKSKFKQDASAILEKAIKPALIK